MFEIVRQKNQVHIVMMAVLQDQDRIGQQELHCLSDIKTSTIASMPINQLINRSIDQSIDRSKQAKKQTDRHSDIQSPNERTTQFSYSGI